MSISISDGKILIIRSNTNYSGIAKLNILLLYIYTFNAVFIPYDTFGLKKLALFILLAANINCYRYLSTKDEKMSVIFGLVVMALTVFHSYLVSGDLIGNFQIGYTFSILLLFPIIKHYHINFKTILLAAVKCMAYFIVIMFLLDAFRILPIYSNPILMWLYRTQNANIGKYPSLLIGISLFLKASPMMLLGMADAFDNNKKIDEIIYLIALILTGTRANIFVGTAFFAFCYVLREKSTYKRFFALLILISVSCFLIYRLRIPQIILLMFEKKISNDSVRSGTLDSIFNYWRERPSRFFVGSGYMGTFYNSGRGTYSRDVELSYWNLLRQVGVFYFIILMYMYIAPIFEMIMSKKQILFVVGYIAYLVIAYTNPFLITSTGLTVVLFMYVIAFDNNSNGGELENVN